MGSLHLAENYQMSDMHRTLLNKARIYLVHNIRPTESLWSTFISKEVLSYDMVDEIKVRKEPVMAEMGLVSRWVRGSSTAQHVHSLQTVR